MSDNKPNKHKPGTLAPDVDAATDAELGAYVRNMVAKYPKQHADKVACAIACGRILVSIAGEMEAGELKFSIEDATYKGKPLGSWSVSIKKECSVPPPGWRCTRGAGHDGPCAAVPVGKVGQ